MSNSLTKKLKSSDGTIRHLIKIGEIYKLHSENGPALIPQGNLKKAEYYLFGIKHSKDQWEDKQKATNGEPFFKTALGKSSGVRV